MAALANSGGGVAVVDADLDVAGLKRRVEQETGAAFRPLAVQPVSRNGAG